MRTAKLHIHIIHFVFGAAVGMLVLRLILKLLGASPDAAFAIWTYAITRPLLAPFLGMFPSPLIEGRFVVEFTTLFAIVAYLVLQYLIIELLDFIHETTHSKNTGKKDSK